MGVVFVFEPVGPVGYDAGRREIAGENGVGEFSAMAGRAGPGVVFGACDEAGANGISFDVADGVPEMAVVHGA